MLAIKQSTFSAISRITQTEIQELQNIAADNSRPYLAKANECWLRFQGLFSNKQAAKAQLFLFFKADHEYETSDYATKLQKKEDAVAAFSKLKELAHPDFSDNFTLIFDDENEKITMGIRGTGDANLLGALNIAYYENDATIDQWATMKDSIIRGKEQAALEIVNDMCTHDLPMPSYLDCLSQLSKLAKRDAASQINFKIAIKDSPTQQGRLIAGLFRNELCMSGYDHAEMLLDYPPDLVEDTRPTTPRAQMLFDIAKLDRADFEEQFDAGDIPDALNVLNRMCREGATTDNCAALFKLSNSTSLKNFCDAFTFTREPLESANIVSLQIRNIATATGYFSDKTAIFSLIKEIKNSNRYSAATKQAVRADVQKLIDTNPNVRKLLKLAYVVA